MTMDIFAKPRGAEARTIESDDPLVYTVANFRANINVPEPSVIPEIRGRFNAVAIGPRSEIGEVLLIPPGAKNRYDTRCIPVSVGAPWIGTIDGVTTIEPIDARLEESGLAQEGPATDTPGVLQLLFYRYVPRVLPLKRPPMVYAWSAAVSGADTVTGEWEWPHGGPVRFTDGDWIPCCGRRRITLSTRISNYSSGTLTPAIRLGIGGSEASNISAVEGFHYSEQAGTALSADEATNIVVYDGRVTAIQPRFAYASTPSFNYDAILRLED